MRSTRESNSERQQIGSIHLFSAVLNPGIDKFTIEFVEFLDSPTAEILFERESI